MAQQFSLADIGIDPGATGQAGVDSSLASFQPAAGSSGFLGMSGGQWAGMGLQALAGYGQSMYEAKQIESANAQSAAEAAAKALNQRKLTEAAADRDYYYNRLNRSRKRKGLAEFRKFKSAGVQDAVPQEQ